MPVKPLKSWPSIFRAFIQKICDTRAGLSYSFYLENPLNAQDRPVSFANLAEELLPAVVNISTLGSASDNGTTSDQRPQFQFPPGSPFEDLFRDFLEKQPQRRRSAMGSGFIIDSSGIVVTNNHVIQDAEEITVTLHDKTQLKATLVGRDPKTDLAVLKVKPTKKLPFVSFGDSKKIAGWRLGYGNWQSFWFGRVSNSWDSFCARSKHRFRAI